MMLTTSISLQSIMETLKMKKFMDLDCSIPYGTIEEMLYLSLLVSRVLVEENSQLPLSSIKAMLVVVVTNTLHMHHHTLT